MDNLKQWLSQPRRLAEPALIVPLVILGGAVAIASVKAVRERAEIQHLTQTYGQLTGVHPETMAGAPSQRDEMVKRISSNRLIAPPPMQLTGVLGDQAIFNGSMMLKVGQSAGDMKIVAIGPNWVTVQTNGQEQKLWVFQPTMSPSMPMDVPPSSARPASGTRRTAAPPGSSAKAPVVIEQ